MASLAGAGATDQAPLEYSVIGLQSLSGAEFDRQYVPQQLADHEATLGLFQIQSNRGQDIELRQFAQRYTPIIQRHVEMLRRMSTQTISSN